MYILSITWSGACARTDAQKHLLSGVVKGGDGAKLDPLNFAEAPVNTGYGMPPSQPQQLLSDPCDVVWWPASAPGTSQLNLWQESSPPFGSLALLQMQMLSD